jgi:urease accessory protein UreE
MAETIDRKYLAGLKYRSSKPVKTEGGVRHQATERALQPGDVLDWKDTGAAVVIVTADGQKHVVEKKAAEKA